MTATRVCALSELEQDSALRVEVDGVAICVVRDSSDEVHAIGDVCTHGDISLAEGFVDGDTIECWVVTIDGDDVLIAPALKKEV